RFAESLQKPLRTYRMEFNLGRPVSSSNANGNGDGFQEITEDVYTSTYSATHGGVTSREGSPKKVSKVELHSDVHHQPNGGSNASSVQFTEIRSLKRVSRANEADGDTILNTPGIRDPVSGRILTVGEAIRLRILDVRSGQLNVNGERLSLEEAVRRQLIDVDLVDNLLRPGAALDRDGRPMSLLEVIQKEILEAENGYDSTEKRIKVTTSHESSPVKRTSTVKYNEKEAKSIVDAIKQGLVDTSNGLYRTETGDLITLADAYEYGYLIRNETIKIAPHTLSLTDSIGQGLVDNGGWVIDRNTGDTFRLDSAIAKNLVNPDLREIVDTKNDIKITVAQALEQGILNAKTGRYMNPLTKEKLTFTEARNRQLICKPMTLKDVCDLNLFDKSDKIASPTRRERVNIPGAISLGVLDSDSIKCVYKSKGELLTLKEALEQEIILPFENRFRHSETGELMTIPEAVDRGLISSVAIKSIFNIFGFKDPHSGEFVSLNTALAKNIVRKKEGRFQLDVGKGVLVDLNEAVAQGLIRPEVHEMLNRKIGVFVGEEHELTLIDLVYHDLIDTKTGFLLEHGTTKVLPLEPAIERKFITPEGALLLISLLNITLTTETVVKTIKRYVTITHTGEQVETQPQVLLSFTEAVRRGLIDENTRTYRDPNTGNVYSVQQALNHGLILPDTEAVPATQEIGSEVPSSKPSSIPLQFETFVTKNSNAKNIHITTEFLDRERKATQTYELPPDGWLLADAISQKLFDPVAGLFVIPGTDRLVSFEECINLKIINRQSAFVVDPEKSKRRVTLDIALDRKMLDATGHYQPATSEKITMKEALDRKLIVFEQPLDRTSDGAANRTIQVTKIPGQPDVIEVSSMDSQMVQVKSLKTPELLSPEPLQLTPNIIYDPSTALVIFTDTGKSDNIVHAVTSGKLDPNLVKIKDPKTGDVITITEAVNRGVLDPQTGAVKDPSGRSISLMEAVQAGALAVCGAPLVAAAGALDLLKTIIDPSTGEEIPIELAYERGLISKKDNSRRSSDGFVVSVGEGKESLVLQRVRKCVLRPKDAAEKGILDNATAQILENLKLFDGGLSLEQSISAGRLDGNQGKIVDPQRGHTLTINEAMLRGILDRNGTNCVFVPLAKSLSIPELKTQGLLDVGSSKIYHPESGQLLTLKEATICEIVDPLAEVVVNGTQRLSLEKAIETGLVDADRCTIGNMKLNDAIEHNVFIVPNYSAQIPPVGMTIPVIVKRHLLDIDLKEITHPISKDRMTVNDAIKKDFVMAIPYTPNANATDIDQALDRKLINTQRVSFTNPMTSEELPLQEAIETGLLEVKPLPEMVRGMQANTAVTSIQETISSSHTITTKTVEIQSGYALISATEVQDTATGEIISVDEARKRGILSDEEQIKNEVLNEEVNINFGDALQRGLLDVTKGMFRHPDSGDVMSISDAVDKGYIATKTTSDEALNRSPEMVHKTSDGKLAENIKDAAKMGLMAVVGAPVLGGMAIAGAVKKVFEKKESEKSSSSTTSSHQISSTTIQVVTKTFEGEPSITDVSLTDIDNDTKDAKGKTPTAGLVDVKTTIEEIVEPNTVESDHNLSSNDQQSSKNTEPVEKPMTTVEISEEDPNQLLETTEIVTTVVTEIKLETVDTEIVEDVNQPDTDLQNLSSTTESKGDSVKEPKDDISSIPSESSVVVPVEPIAEATSAKQPAEAECVIADPTKSMTTDLNLELAPKSELVTEELPTKYSEKIDQLNDDNKLVNDLSGNATQPSGSVEDMTEKVEKPLVGDKQPISSSSVDEKAEISELSPVDKIEETAVSDELKSDTLVEKLVEKLAPEPSVSNDDGKMSTELQLKEQQQPVDSKAEVVQETAIVGQPVTDDQRPTELDSSETSPQKDEALVTQKKSPEDLMPGEKDSKLEVTCGRVEQPPSEEKVHSSSGAPSTLPLEFAAETTTAMEPLDPSEVSAPSVEQISVEDKLDSSAVPSEQIEVSSKSAAPTASETITPSDTIFHAKERTPERPTELKTTKEPSGSDTGKKVLDAAKLGLMAVVGAPILAGKAVVDALKKDRSDGQQELPESKTPKKASIADATAAFLEQERSPGDGKREFRELEKTIGGILEQVDADGKLLKTPEKHSESYERLPLGEAIAQGKIIPKVCRVMVDDKQMPYTVEEGLNNRNVRIYDIVDVLSQQLVSFVEGEADGLVIDETLTKQKLIDLGVYDADTNSFINPNNGERISFRDLVYNSGLVDPTTIFVMDLGRDKYESLDVALQKHLIDKNTGHMLDNKSGKKVKFVECCKRAWVIQREPSSENLDQSPTLSEVLDAGQFNPQTGELVQNNQSIPIAEALRAGFIDNDSVSVRDPTDGEVLPLRVAIERGIIDLKLGVIFNRETQEEIDLNDAYNRGYMLEGKRKPISLEAAVRKGLYNPESGLILDTITEEMVDVQQSVDKGIVDPKISNVKDTKENVLVPLQDALDKKLIDSESGKMKDTETDQLLPLDVALEKKMMDTKQVTHSLIEVLNKEFYDPNSGKILNPGNGEENILKDAIDSQLVEIDSVLVRDEQKDKVVKCEEAIESGLLDDVRGVLTRPELTLDRAYQKGYILSNKKPISLTDALLRGFYDQTSGLLRFDGAPGVTLEKAIADGEISTADLIVRDPKSRGVISLSEAIRGGLVDPVSGMVIDSGSGLSMGMLEALDRGIIVVAKRRCSLPDAVFRGLYDPKSGQFSSTTTPEKMSTERAIRRGMLDPESTIVNVAGKIQPFELAIENGTVDVKRGTILDEEGNKIDFREAFDRGLLVEVRKPISLSEAVVKGIYRESSGMFMDPKTGRKLTLAQAIAEKVIDPNSVQIKDPTTGFYRDLDLVEAIESDLINGQDSNVKHSGDKITLKHAFDIGLLYDSKAPISLQRAIHQGIYDDKSGKIVDPVSGRKITLHEATRKFVINPQLPCYFNEKDEVMLNLFETCRAKLIDRREGVFKEPGSEVFIPLNEALALGLIVDIESAGFGLYETLAMGFYDKKSGKIIHPITNRKITLEEACKEDIVNPGSSIIKNTVTGKFIRLDDAISAKIIDDKEGVYVLPKGNKIDLQEARRKGLIVTNQKLLSLEKAIKLHLYRQDSGTFVEPISGDHVNLQEALDIGLLDFETSVYKDAVTGQDKPLRAAIADQDIDVQKGKVLDRKTDRTYNFDVAFNKGLLVTVQRPITGKILERKESIDNLLQESPLGKSPKEMSLKDALRHEIVSIDKSVMKHPKSRVFVPLRVAIQEKLISEDGRATVDPKQSFFVFDSSSVVFVQKPLTFDEAVESSLLDLSTGKFLYKTPTIGGGATESDVTELLNLKDAIGQGYIDPESVLLKDGAKKKFLPLPEAFRKGLIDAEKSNVLDTNTSKLTTLQTAVDNGLLITPKRAICLMEALDYNMYNTERGTFEDPFHPNQLKTLNETIQSGLIDPTTTMVRDISNNSVIVPLLTAVGNGLIDPIGGHFNLESEQTKIDLVKARDRGYLIQAEQRQAVVEKFALCEDHLAKLLEWITKVEHEIASVGGPKERVDDLRNQINSLKQIKDDIDAQSRPVASCLEQVRQLVLTGGDVLSAPEVAALESSGRELRSRVDKAQDRTGKLLRRLGAARDELGKLRSELDTFSAWLQTSRRTLEDKESTLSDLNRLSTQSESVKEFHGDVVAHQADLRFITMAAQKFVDECKDYLSVLNDFRTTLPERLPHIEQVSNSDSPIRQEVSLVTAQYRDLLNRANALLDRLAGLGGRQRDYQESLEKVRSWLRDVQPRVSAVLSDPIAADPQSVQDQMNQTKALQSEFLSQGRLIDNVQHSLDALLKSLAGRLSPSEVSALEMPVEDVKDKYNQLLEALGDRSKLLDTALVQSQGVQDALDGLSGWINQSEDKFKLQNRPASLIKDRLNEQVREHRGLLNDLESHRTSLESVTLSARELMANASNARLAKRIETNLSDVTGRFEKLLDKALKRGEFLEDTLAQLNKFNEDAAVLEQELSNLQEALDGRELTSLPADTLTQRMIELTRNKEHLRPLYETCVRLGKDLIAKRDVTDTGVVRDRIKALENSWKNLDVTLEEKLKLSKQKAEQLNAYEDLKDQVLVWLSSIETRTNNLAPVAVDIETIKYQIEEVKPLVKEHRDYAVTVDKVNDLGAQYDALVRPDSPTRKRSVYSPIKRSTVSPMRRMSGDARSPSPTKGLGIVGPSPTVSPGFGSRRSSQDGFQLTDLTPIQQQLTEINNRYSLVGARLNDRQNELDSVRDEVRKHQESLKTLANFLDKIQRQVPKEVISNKDEAERCNKQARKVLEEMYEKQSLLDSTKAQVKDLLKRKPDVQGADRLRSELDAVADRWKNLHDLCKDRINFSEQLRDFLDTHDNLNTWLGAKERMLTVLGPISSDPRMVQSQVQQVQVLREEFRGQQPQLNHLQEVGNAVLEYLRESSPEGQSVASKLKTIQKKWDDLVSRLDDRAQSLGAAADTSKEFDAGLNRLREALQNISDNLDALPTDRDHQETLRKIENLERQLEGQRPLLADSEAAGEALCRVLSDPASRADVNARLAAVGKQYQNLQKKLDNRKAETDSALRDGRQFAETCARTLGWLSGELGNLTERLLVSAHRPTLQHQIDTHEPIYREVMSREHEVIMLLNKGRELQEKPGQVPDRTVQRDLEKISQQWERLRNAAVDRQSRLQTCMEHCKKHSAASETFLAWLRGAEDKLASFKPGILKKSQLDQQLKELQTFRSDVWKKSGEYENTRGLGESFIGACDVDKDPIKAELQDMKDRWERLNNDLIARAQTLDTCAKRLGDFNEELRDLEHAVGRCEDRLAAHDALGGAAKDPKLLDRVKTIKEDASALRRPLQSVRKLAGDIAVEARAVGGDAEHLKHDVDGISDRIEDLHARLDDRCGELQSAATAVSQFNDAVKALGVDLNELESQIDSLSPPAREIKTVVNQLDEVAGILSKIDRTAGHVASVERAGEQLVDSGFAPDTVGTRDQIGTLRRQLGKLENRARDHDDALQKALKALQKFYDLHQHTLDDLNDVADQVKKMKPVSSELEQIRNQQDDFRRFKQRHVEPLIVNIDEVNRSGQDLIRSAQGGVPTGVLEKDLEKINEKWNDLKDKMNERDRRLDVGLLQSGKFQEALDGLSKWLKDTEEMVANQKPPSADYKVVKAQLQEQKFLTKMLMDRQNSMSSLFQLGQEVAAGCDASEKAAIERQLKELMGRFDALTDAAQTRTLDLEQAMHVAKQFQDQLIPLTKWLDGAERAVKAMELVPTDEEKIQQRIHEHERLHDEILSKQPDFSELADIAGQLMELVGDDEGVVLSEKVKHTTDRYTDLVHASENIGHVLNESRQGLRHLVLTYQDLVSWMENMENRLQRFRVIPVHTEKLLEQMDVLVELNEDIASRSPNVESTVEAGSELMKHISSDEALQLKDKLDSLQRRYGELTTKGGDLLKHAQDALPLVQQFHQSHIRLVDWMQAAESTLATGDSNEIDIVRLEADLSEMRPVLETVNSVGPQLCQISPGEGASTIEGIVTRDNRRFEAIVEQIQRKAERLHLSKQRSNEVTADIDELLEWFRDMDATLRDADPPAMTPKLVRAQLQEHRSINDDISSQKGRVRDVTSAAKKVLRESQPNENTIALREKLEDLKEVVDTVAGLCSNRLAILEQALPLSEHFADSHTGLVTWLNDMEHQISMLAMPALRPDQIAIQQDKNERLTQSISEHKPLLDKLNKTGEALMALVAEDDSAKISEILESDNARYAALRTELRERQNALEQALQESSQFSDKLEGMLRALQNTAEQANQADPISAHPPKIRDQIEDNAALVEDIEKRGEAFAAVKRAATDVISKATNQSDPAVRDIKKKLDKLNNLWNELQKTTSKRGSALDNTLSVADKFWKEMRAVMETLKELQEALQTQEPPAAQPQAIQKQQVALQEIRQEIDQTKPEVEQVRRTGSNLMSLCGEPDKPEVKKHIEDLDHAWDNITALYAKREENLIDAMEKAMEFHETLQNLLNFLAKAEDRFQKLGPLGSDIEAVKKQIEQLKHFKDDVDPHMVEVEALNRQAVELTERTSAEQASAIREPLNSVNRRWENLLRGMVERQKQLEHALLHLGQFQHALNELLVWISKTDSNLDELKPIPGDPQLLEVELAKLKVLANDIHAHQSSVDTLNDAGRKLIENDRGSLEASTTQDKLQQLNKQWRDLLQKAADRQHELEESLRDAQAFTAEIQDLLGWLGDVDAIIGASKPVGGLPETASEQLERFMEVYNELEENRPKVETLIAQGQEYVRKQTQMQVSASNLQHTLRTLKQRWDAVVSRASDKKIKLEIALKEATEFHDALQAFVEWLTLAEKQLSSASAVSRVLETIQQQMEEHKILQKDVSIHRESMLLLDKKGTHLKYFSQKQDVILIKNLLVSVQHRWERVVAKAAERTRALDHGYKEAREFHDAWLQLTTWLKETEITLDTLAEESTNDAVKIKKHLEKLREIQRHLQSKESFYDSTMRNGKGLMDRAPKSDEPVLSKMMNELKDSWKRVCHKSVERQRKFEEALLLSGQFADALQALLEWLRKAKARLAEDGPVHGDLDTVTTLVDHHKQLESDLDKRSAQMQSVMKTGKDLEKSDETRETSKNLRELQKLWEDVQDLSTRRKSRLEVALKEAERLHKSVHMLLEWLSEAEQKLRFAAAAPDDEAQANDLLDEHARFMKELREKEFDKEETLGLANSILSKAHSDAVPIIKNWISIIQSRWDEISQWALSRQSKLESHLKSLKDLDESIEELLAWLAGLEATLLNLEQEALPDEIPPLEAQIADHKEFMENTARRQGEVDRACKPRQPPPGLKETRKPSRGVLKTPVFKGSRDQGLNSRRTSRVSPGRETQTPERDRLPHYGPRFSPSNQPETELRSPRAKLLWDKWRYVWMLAWERQRRLHDHLLYLQDLERVRQFSWEEWRKRFLKFMNHKKSRLTDLFRKMDKDNNGLIPREVFIDGIIGTKFDTSKLEMNAVADLFDRNGEGLIDWQEFIAALRPDWQDRKPKTDADKIHDEVKRLVMLCTCRQKFRVFQVGEGKYRFGDSQKLRLVRILRSTVMVRVGGGWVALDEFLVKNDPCRAKGRTNIELREQFILADGVSQSMAVFKPRMSVSTGSGSTQAGSPIPTQGPIVKVRERSSKSISMSRPSRSSLSASTPDSLSDNESSLGTPGRFQTPSRKTSVPIRSQMTPGGSRANSRPSSRPASRAGSKPPSRHGSTLSLDSTDDATPSRIPTRRITSTTTPRPSRLSVGSTTTTTRTTNGVSSRTASGAASPAPTRNGGMSRSSSIPTLVGPNSRKTSGTSTPSGMQTPRRTSVEPQTPGSTRPDRSSRGTTPATEKRAPFRL
ncbi:AAEL002829-PA, partial [Aedes aegypti]